eukprot:TRINITY_DN9480_c0_g1_i1.p1 TRINITY_DN9480_c0_g1~~TRINITY_DN9480_c0_g1_i1.p1  ORF type:complete len:247 (-),score=41.20 TRINITY_DN9480_c0_g1_i1:110-850(-)
MAFSTLFCAICALAASEPVTCDENGCEPPNVLLLQTKQNVAPIQASWEKAQRELWTKLKSVKGDKTLSIKSIHDSVVEIAAAKLNVSEVSVDEAFKTLDKKGDGVLDETELYYINNVVLDETAESKTDQEVVALEHSEVSDTSAALLQTKKSKGWPSVNLGGGLIAQIFDGGPRYFKPRINVANSGASAAACIVVSLILSSNCYRYIYSNNDMCRCLPSSAVNGNGDIDWTWYYSGSGNHIYYYNR